MRRGTDAIGLPVITFDHGAKIDRVIDLVFDPDSNQVRALVVDEGGWFRGPRVVPFDQIKALGPDGVIVGDRHAVVDTSRLPDIRDLLRRNIVLKGTKLMTTDGSYLGTIMDLYFDPENGKVEGYEVSGGLFADAYTGRSFVPAPSTLNIGRDVAFVPPSVADEMAAQVGGIKGAIAGAGDQLSTAAQGAGTQIQTAAQNANDRLTPAVQKANEQLQASQDAAVRHLQTARDNFNQNVPNAMSSAHQGVLNSQDVAREQLQQSTSRLNEGTRRTLASEALDETEGRVALQTVAADNGLIIVDQGQVIDGQAIHQARVYHKEQELFDASGLTYSSVMQARTNRRMDETRRHVGTAAGSARSAFADLMDRTRMRLMDWQRQVEQERRQDRIHDALGRPVTRVILDKDDCVILNTGELITNDAVEQAREAGVLDILLNSVSAEKPRISQDQLRAPEPGDAALENVRTAGNGH